MQTHPKFIARVVFPDGVEAGQLRDGHSDGESTPQAALATLFTDTVTGAKGGNEPWVIERMKEYGAKIVIEIAPHPSGADVSEAPLKKLAFGSSAAPAAADLHTYFFVDHLDRNRPRVCRFTNQPKPADPSRGTYATPDEAIDAWVERQIRFAQQQADIMREAARLAMRPEPPSPNERPAR